VRNIEIERPPVTPQYFPLSKKLIPVPPVEWPEENRIPIRALEFHEFADKGLGIAANTTGRTTKKSPINHNLLSGGWG
jgi:hypothetical protein